MKCPFCLSANSVVKDSRDTEDGSAVRRRRHCDDCKARFTTMEKVQLRELWVIKKSGAKRILDREKIHNSIATALRKRNISENIVANLINIIMKNLESNTSREIHTSQIGEMIMEELLKIDHVAYIRFASVYKEFKSAKDFAKFISKINL
jgi:transcriptional repressor NrdR